MNTKEGIEFVKEIMNSEYVFLDYRFKFIETISLLERGEKYEAIVKNVEDNLKDTVGIGCNMNARDTLYMILQVRRKYFPEPVKKYITIEVESEKESEVDAGMEDIKELVDNMGCPKMKIANEWKEE